MRIAASPEGKPNWLEDELTADLADTCWSGVGRLTELPLVGIASHAGEVGMVEDVEELDAEIELHSFREPGVFTQAGIGVDGARTVEPILPEGAGHAAGFVAVGLSTAVLKVVGEGRRIEEVVSRSMRVQLLDGRNLVGK